MDLSPNAKSIARLLTRELSKASEQENMEVSIQNSRKKVEFNELSRAAKAYNEAWNYELHKPITSHRPLIGPVIVFAKKVMRKLLKWHIRPLFEDQIKYNASVTWALNEVKGIIENYDVRIQELENAKQELKNANEELESVNQNLGQALNNLTCRFEEFIDESLEGFDYLKFENKYRGSREDIKKRQEVYLGYFLGKDRVLDIGCGRGEFVELLLGSGVAVTGIDLNHQMVNFCQEAQLPVVQGDALKYLESLPDSSLGGVFLGQVIEHLNPKDLLTLVKMIFKKLSQDSYVVFETPNPLSVGIYASFFYQDLTHIKPVHPETMKFIIESEGFINVDIKFLAPTPESDRLQPLRSDSIGEDRVAKNFEKLNDLLYGYQDYAIIARK